MASASTFDISYQYLGSVLTWSSECVVVQMSLILYQFDRTFACKMQLSSSSRLCAVRRTGPLSRTGASDAPRCAGTAVRNGNYADVVYYLNRTDYLWLILSHRELSSPNSLDFRTAQNGQHRHDRCDAPRRHAVRKTQSLSSSCSSSMWFCSVSCTVHANWLPVGLIQPDVYQCLSRLQF